jgi:hypothetical protein
MQRFVWDNDRCGVVQTSFFTNYFHIKKIHIFIKMNIESNQIIILRKTKQKKIYLCNKIQIRILNREIYHGLTIKQIKGGFERGYWEESIRSSDMLFSKKDSETNRNCFKLISKQVF